MSLKSRDLFRSSVPNGSSGELPAFHAGAGRNYMSERPTWPHCSNPLNPKEIEPCLV